MTQRYRQVWDEEAEKHRLVPINEAAHKASVDAGIIVRGNFDAFSSPIDGSRISTQRELEDHMKKHNVVDSREFSAEWYQKKVEERARLHNNERTKEQVLRDRQRINEIISRYER